MAALVAEADDDADVVIAAGNNDGAPAFTPGRVRWSLCKDGSTEATEVETDPGSAPLKSGTSSFPFVAEDDDFGTIIDDIGVS